jgi:hypothetical protein
VLRSWFLWLAYWFSQTQEDNGKISLGKLNACPANFALVIWFVSVLVLAGIWNLTIEVWCAQITALVEDICLGRKEILLSFSKVEEATEE